jgi:hypothetical protein
VTETNPDLPAHTLSEDYPSPALPRVGSRPVLHDTRMQDNDLKKLLVKIIIKQ